MCGRCAGDVRAMCGRCADAMQAAVPHECYEEARVRWALLCQLVICSAVLCQLVISRAVCATWSYLGVFCRMSDPFCAAASGNKETNKKIKTGSDCVRTLFLEPKSLRSRLCTFCFLLCAIRLTTPLVYVTEVLFRNTKNRQNYSRIPSKYFKAGVDQTGVEGK